MPFTPFHLGPALFLGLLLLVEVDLPTFLAANLAVDLRSVLVFFDVLDGPLHGPLHTLLGALVVAALLTGVSYAARRYVDPVLATLRLSQDWSWRTIAAGSFGGVTLHLLLDAFLYEGMALFYPLAGNPLRGYLRPVRRLRTLCPHGRPRGPAVRRLPAGSRLTADAIE